MDKYKPKFEHDCKQCIFKGSSGGFDIWVHDNGGYTSILARDGDEGWEYISIISTMARLIEFRHEDAPFIRAMKATVPEYFKE